MTDGARLGSSRRADPAEVQEHRGVVASVTFPGADDATVFRADLAPRLPEPGSPDPMDRVRLVWHGRRRVPGVMPGEWLRVRGRVVEMDGVPTLHNPEFDLVDGRSASR